MIMLILLNTTLTQTEVFVHLNDFVEDDAIVIGSAGSLPERYATIVESCKGKILII